MDDDGAAERDATTSEQLLASVVVQAKTTARLRPRRGAGWVVTAKLATPPLVGTVSPAHPRPDNPHAGPKLRQRKQKSSPGSWLAWGDASDETMERVPMGGADGGGHDRANDRGASVA